MVAISEAMNMFWGVTLDGGKRYSQTVEHAFHISMAALEGAHKSGEGVAVMIHHDKAEFLLCSLGKHCPQQQLDLNFTEGEEVTFFLNGKGVVHLTGYLQPDEPPYPSELHDGVMDLSEEDMSGEDDSESGESYEEGDSTASMLAIGDDEEDSEDDEEFDPAKGKRKRNEALTSHKKAKLFHKIVPMDSDEDDSDDGDDSDDEDSDDEDEDDSEFEWEDESDLSDFFDDEAEEVPEGEEDDDDDEDEDDLEHIALSSGRMMEQKGKRAEALADLVKSRDKKSNESPKQKNAETPKEKNKQKKVKTPGKESQKEKSAETPKDKHKQQEKTPKAKSKSENIESPMNTPGKKSQQVSESPKKTPGKDKHKEKGTDKQENGHQESETPPSSKKKKKKNKKNKEGSETPEKATPKKSQPSTPASDKALKEGKTPDKSAKKQDKTPGKTPKKVLQGGLTAQELKEGHGPEAMAGRMVSVYYTGKLQNGKVFDSSTSGAPFKFKLGKQEVIKGWDVGVAGMKVGGKRKLIIPPKLGYGGQRMGDIPPNSTLTFEVELKAVS